MLTVRELARSITALENHDPRALEALRAALQEPEAGNGLLIGITGPPGAGKSSLVDAIARELRGAGKTLAILAVDPSSRVTGGAILGDRIRMQRHHGDPGVFIRSMATRGEVGGLAATTRNVAEWLRAQNFDYVFIETVGVGQDEVAVAGVADIVAVVLVPGMGDDVQTIKAGVMEIADVFVINKADYPGANRTAQDVEAMLNLGHGPKPPILQTVAVEGRGVSELIEILNGLPRRAPSTTEPHFSIDHLGIAVRSIDEAMAFYRSLGFAEPHREIVEQEKVQVAMLPASESRIELLEAVDAESAIARFIEKRGPGLHHVALRVPDLNRSIRQLAEAGVRVLNSPQRGAGGHLYVFVHPSGTGGVLWELIQDQGAGAD